MDSKFTLALAIFSAAAWAQEPETLIRADTRLVEVDVVVRSKGKPVEDLKAEDFTLLDQGKPQRIANFAIRRAGTQPRTRKLDPGEISNRINRLGEEPESATVILLDTLNSDPEDLAETRRQLLIYLGRTEPRDRLALYSLNKTLRVIQDFTDDPERLRRIVTRWKAESSVDVNAPLLIADLPKTGDALTDGMVDAAAKEMTDAANQNRAETTAFAMELIAKHLAGLPGRKKLIWAGASFSARTSEQRSRLGTTQIEIRDFAKYIEKSVRALNEAQVAVYPIDPRSVCKNGCGSDSGGLMAKGIETMNLFAGGTGGRAFYAISDIASAFEEAVNDSEVTYALGFSPDSSKLDGKFHKLSVKVARKDIDVRHRQGYVASDDAPPTQPERQKSLKEVMENPLDATGIGLSGWLVPSATERGANEVVLRIDTQELALETEQTKDGTPVWTALLTVATVLPKQLKPNGSVNDVRLAFTEARLKEVLRDGYRIRVAIDNKGFPGPTRVTVQDRRSGKAGSLTLEIPER